MNRREVLRYTAWITGSAVSASLTSAILSGCSEQTSEQNKTTGTPTNPNSSHLHFFTPEQFALVGLLADTILPRTDSPSATDVKVHITLDSMLGQVFDVTYQTTHKTHWLALEKYLGQQQFLQLSPTAQVEALKALELNKSDDTTSAKKALIEFKQQVIAYYLTTEEIGEKFLNYLPIPGSYKPCISVAEVNNKAWAL
ncbi:twin-arginine translocation pathway signal protein [Cellvibrio zantedeschiae]|uniref:Twin-arginine translocation pathway signal protein n=1 Tax=Cellvibrio zantedeschiae TaxID=1237077 RepID=A0ABQ3ASP4_9GAMM|nr:gluconate 2-dehydrogenase subunit 3 family protein [Cellvibrio zantedeschiae]GGY66138.1 twin-arginine translocation pathway signal protein [Cellvibrio zantedeschiae]